MKKFIIRLIVIVGIVNMVSCLPGDSFCEIECPEDIVVTPEDLTYSLRQKHFTALFQIDESIYFGVDNQAKDYSYRVIDTHIAWLKFSDGSQSDFYTYSITYKIDYTTELQVLSPKDLCGKTFNYDNGFKVNDSVTIECQTQIESFDDVTICFNEEYLRFCSPELDCCQIIPLTLSFTDYNSSELYGTVVFSLTSTNGNLIEKMEQSLIFKLI